MEKLIASGNIEKVARQRNLFVFLTITTSICSMLLALKLSSVSEKTILVPGITSQLWIDGSSISASYLEESTLMYLSALLDLNPEVIDQKSKIIFRYVSNTNPKYISLMQKYFAEAQEKYKRFDLSTYFTVKNLVLDTKNLSVIANGTLTSCFGNTGLETTNLSYRISYELAGGHLRVKEFASIEEDTK